MPVTSEFIEFPIAEITVLRDERQRREVNVEDLLQSVRAHGVLQAIIIERMPDGGHVLVVGERRLEAARQCGLETIPARIALNLSPLERQLIELLENIKRRDLVWQDLVETTLRIHEINCQLVESWTAQETADQTFMSKGQVSVHMIVARVLREQDARIANCKTVREAYNLLRRRQQRAAGDALQELLETADEALPAAAPVEDVDDGEAPQMGLEEFDAETDLDEVPRAEPTAGAKALAPLAPPVPCLPGKPPVVAAPQRSSVEQTILNTDFTSWLTDYTGPTFSIVHCDFPYGINVFQADSKRNEDGAGRFAGQTQYDDTADTYFSLLRTLCQNLDKIMSRSAHLMFWYSERHYAATRQMFAELAPSLTFAPYSLVWLKSDNAGISGDLNRLPRHVYETAFLAYRGKRNLVRSSGDAYAAPTDRRLHPSCKPEPVLRHFLGIITDDTSTLFDPTCGSGTALRVGEELGCKHVLGLEIDLGTAEIARGALRNARLLRNASKIL